MEKKEKIEKSFNNCIHNVIHLTFPNKNSISIIWGRGSYTENHNFGSIMNISESYKTFLESNDAEIMILNAPVNKEGKDNNTI